MRPRRTALCDPLLPQKNRRPLSHRAPTAQQRPSQISTAQIAAERSPTQHHPPTIQRISLDTFNDPFNDPRNDDKKQHAFTALTTTPEWQHSTRKGVNTSHPRSPAFFPSALPASERASQRFLFFVFFFFSFKSPSLSAGSEPNTFHSPTLSHDFRDRTNPACFAVLSTEE